MAILVIKNPKIHPKPYLDTNVILDYIRKRNKDSVKLLKIIKRKKIKCCTSYFTLLELIDAEQENIWIKTRINKGVTFDDIFRKRYPRELTKAQLRKAFSKIDRTFYDPFVETKIVDIMIPNGNSWDSILHLLQRSNTTTNDVFHIDAALGSNCNIFISNDSDLVKLINKHQILLASRPKELEQTLMKEGMECIVCSKQQKKNK